MVSSIRKRGLELQINRLCCTELHNDAAFLTSCRKHKRLQPLHAVSGTCHVGKQREWSCLPPLLPQHLLIISDSSLRKSKEGTEGACCKRPQWLMLVRFPCWLLSALISKCWNASRLHPENSCPVLFSCALSSTSCPLVFTVCLGIFYSNHHFL